MTANELAIELANQITELALDTETRQKLIDTIAQYAEQRVIEALGKRKPRIR